QPKRSILQDIQSQAAATSKVPSSTDALSLAASLGDVLPLKPITAQSQIFFQNDDDSEKENESNSNDNTTIFVEKLPATVTLDEIYDFFFNIGDIEHDNTIGNAKMHHQAGKYCTITSQDSKTAALAVYQYDGVPLPDVGLSPLSTLTGKHLALQIPVANVLLLFFCDIL
ncbi:unnamed protein product, partial [Didymodactylos carnosus]